MNNKELEEMIEKQGKIMSRNYLEMEHLKTLINLREQEINLLRTEKELLNKRIVELI